MAPELIASPFIDDPVAEVPLRKTPLESVLFQIRFPGHLSRLEQALSDGRLQAALAEEYPYAQQQETFNLVVQPGQQPQPQPGPPIWTLQDASQKWTCNLAPDSFGLMTTAYESRTDFVRRAEILLNCVCSVSSPPKVNRVGVRYFNRVARPLDDGGGWFMTLAEGARGILATTPVDERKGVVNSISQVLYERSSVEKLQCRWGILPGRAVIDPSMSPIEDGSWVLDIDAYYEELFDFSVQEISTRIERLASRAYTFFRWALTPASLQRFSPVEEAPR